ncbi:MAG TPA: putative transporter [Porphyromonadaceae bacterium]|nr:putative transporter [Paramuribaculum sp.]HAB40735.1 putative transporter [Porphyromonadaceae bacterium]
MNWFENLFCSHGPVQAVCVLSVIIAIGLGLGKIRVWGVSLGVTFVFFMGILAGHLGFSIDPQMLKYAQDFGLVLFVYELGLKVGPGFFSSFRSGGLKLNMYGLALVALGTLTAVAIAEACGIGMADMVGVLCGATTNTPALGAAQQALQQLGISASGAALSCAVTYPLGVVGVILAMIVVRKLFTRPSDMKPRHTEDSDHTYVAEFQAVNPGINGMTIRDIHNMLNLKFVISRVWHEGKVSIPGPDRRIMEGDRLLVVTNEEDIPRLMMLFGKKTDKDWNRPDINWNRIDKNLVSKTVVVSKPGLNGKRLGSLHLRNNYEINISRVMRSGVRLLADPQLVLQLGDRVTIVGLAADVDKVAALLGNSVNELRDPNLASVFIGMVLGLVLGSIPILIPGMSTPVKLGLAGGPIVVGILIGRFGPSFHLITYTTQSANLMLRGIGLSLYLACLGLEAGESFLDTILRADGLVWIAAGFVITLIPSIIMLLGAMRWGRLDYGTASGMVCGAMANPMALTYANDSVKGDEAAVAYASVYPLSMFTRVVIAQLLVLLFL